MAFNFNGNVPKNIIYNGYNVAKLVYNNVVVWVQKFLSTVRGTMKITLEKAVEGTPEEVKAFGKCEQRKLPEGYTELEYLESTGTQYIDTNLPVTADLRLEIDFKLNSTGTNRYIMGRYTNNNGSFYIYQQQAYFQVAYGCTYSNTTKTVDTDRHYWKFYIENGQTKVECDNEGVLSKAILSNIEQTSIRIAGCTSSNALSNSTYVVKMYQNNVLICDLVPARRNSDNVLGMYDTVNDTFYTNQGTGTFVAGLEIVPTPSNPIPIYCNNGELKVRNKSGLPLGYQAVEYLENTGEQYIDTNLYVSSKDINIKTKVYTPSMPTSEQDILSTLPLSSYTGAGRLVLGLYQKKVFLYARTGAGGDSDPNASSSEYQNAQTFNIDATYNSTQQTKTLVVNGPTTFASYNADPRSSVKTIRLFRQGSGTNPFIGRIYYLVYSEDGVAKLNLIPCRRNSDNVLGMYDTVTDTFYTNAGTGTFTAGPNVDDMEVYADGTVETIEIHGKNLFDKNQTYLSGFVNSTTGQFVPAGVGNTQRSFCISCQPNTTYVLSGMTANSAWGSFTSNAIESYATNFTVGNGTVTTGANDKYLIGMAYTTNGQYDYRNTLQVEEGSTATAYEPYFNDGEATCENLLSVGDYEDIQEVISGDVVRKIGIKVFNGSEDWTYANSRFRLNISDYLIGSSIMALIISHYKLPAIDSGSIANGEARFGKEQLDSTVSNKNELVIHDDNYISLDSYKTWLASQYANGTPVIIVYPLETPTAETATAQPMNLQKGTNIIEVTEASLDNLEIEATYYRTM